jgi:hypothetical protein
MSILCNSRGSRRRILTAALVSALLFTSLAGTLFMDYARANPIMNEPKTVNVYVQSPLKNMVYNTTTIPLKFYVSLPPVADQESKVQSVRYWLDGQLLGQDSGEDLPKIYSVALNRLSNGDHTIRTEMEVHYIAIYRTADNLGVYASFDLYLTGSSEIVYFTVDTRVPSVHVLMSQESFEASGSTVDVSLNFTVSKPVSWLGYSLDGRSVVTVTGQVASTNWWDGDNYQLVLDGLPVGGHSLTVYALDSAGNRGESEPFNFTVTQQSSSVAEQAQPEIEQTESFSIKLAVIGISAAVVAVSSGLMLYFKKRKH